MMTDNNNLAGKIHFDEAINDHFSFANDFSEEALEIFLKACGIEKKNKNEDILLSFNVAIEQNDTLKFTNAGILFFAKEPQRFFPESYVTAVKYKTLDRHSIIDQKNFLGSPIQQIEDVMAFIVRHMSAAALISPENSPQLGTRKDVYDYPIVALREAIVNAVAHRDYFYDASHIYIHMYPDKINIENPGGLFHGLTLENYDKRSVRRNRLIADLLHRSHYIERVGSGFDRMKRALTENNNPSLEISSTNFFSLNFYKRLDNTLVLAASLTKRQVSLYFLLQEQKSITTRETALALDISEDTALRELNTLLKEGLIIKLGTGKTTEYRLK